MIRYIDMDAVVATIANEVRKNESLAVLRAYIFDGLKEVGGPYKSLPKEYELLIDNHRGYLPEDVVWIDEARFIMVDQKQEAEASTADTGKQPNESPLSNYPKVKYIGEMNYSNRHCDDCNYTYSIYEDCTVYTSFDSGYLVLLARVRNDKIPNIPELRTFLKYYAEWRYFENRLYAADEGAVGIYDRLSDKINTLLARAYGAVLQYQISESHMDEQNQGPVTKWLGVDATQRRLRNGKR